MTEQSSKRPYLASNTARSGPRIWYRLSPDQCHSLLRKSEIFLKTEHRNALLHSCEVRHNDCHVSSSPQDPGARSCSTLRSIAEARQAFSKFDAAQSGNFAAQQMVANT